MGMLTITLSLMAFALEIVGIVTDSVRYEYGGIIGVLMTLTPGEECGTPDLLQADDITKRAVCVKQLSLSHLSNFQWGTILLEIFIVVFAGIAPLLHNIFMVVSWVVPVTHTLNRLIAWSS